MRGMRPHQGGGDRIEREETTFRGRRPSVEGGSLSVFVEGRPSVRRGREEIVRRELGDRPCVEGGTKLSIERDETVRQWRETIHRGRRHWEEAARGSSMWWEGRTMSFRVGKFKNSTGSPDIRVSTDLNK